MILGETGSLYKPSHTIKMSALSQTECGPTPKIWQALNMLAFLVLFLFGMSTYVIGTYPDKSWPGGSRPSFVKKNYTGKWDSGKASYTKKKGNCCFS
jgi:hypothetical protein